MSGPRQAAQLVRLAIKAGLEVDTYPDGECWVAVIGRPGFDIEVNWRRRDRRWVFAHAGDAGEWAKVRRFVRKGLR